MFIPHQIIMIIKSSSDYVVCFTNTKYVTASDCQMCVPYIILYMCIEIYQIFLWWTARNYYKSVNAMIHLSFIIWLQIKAPGSSLIIVGTHLDKIHATRKELEHKCQLWYSEILKHKSKHIHGHHYVNIMDVCFVGIPEKGKPLQLARLVNAIYDVAMKINKYKGIIEYNALCICMSCTYLYIHVYVCTLFCYLGKFEIMYIPYLLQLICTWHIYSTLLCFISLIGLMMYVCVYLCNFR